MFTESDLQERELHILKIEDLGFEKIKWYDADIEYHYYDAYLNDFPVEVRIKENHINWRYLGVPLEQLEWFSLNG